MADRVHAFMHIRMRIVLQEHQYVHVFYTPKTRI
jgi:hypothetical protein